MGQCHSTIWPNFFSAPRFSSGFGSKRLLNSYASIDGHLRIVGYNDDFSLNFVNEFQDRSFSWSAVVACDHYYLALSQSTILEDANALTVITFQNSSSNDLTKITIQINATLTTRRHIAVSPSGRNFVFLDGTRLLVFEVDLQMYNWTLIMEEPILPNIIMQTNLVMSDTKISFIFNRTNQFIYDYKADTTSIRFLSNESTIEAMDTYNDYWIYASNKGFILEFPDGSLRTFNHSFKGPYDTVSILPPQLSATRDSIDIALFSGNVILGTLNTATNKLDIYNTLPSKSLGLEYIINAAKPDVFMFTPGYNAIFFKLDDRIESVALAVPSLPGNHSCSMFHGNRLATFWCGDGGSDPTDPCPRGTYQPNFGYTKCELCPEGTFQPKEGSITCLPCKDDQYCPPGTFLPEIISKNSSTQVVWTFPISESTTSFEEILLVLLFASSLTNTPISLVLLGCVIITAALLISLFVKYYLGVNLHRWLAKIDIHKKTKYKVKPKANGSLKVEEIKLDSVFGGYLTLIAAYILLVGLITTIIYVTDYHPLMVGRDKTTDPSQNSFRTASVQDYNTQSKASDLANFCKDNLSMNISVVMYNYQAFLHPADGPISSGSADDDETINPTIKNCYEPFGNKCGFQLSGQNNNSIASFKIEILGPIRITESDVKVEIAPDASFTFAVVEISASFGEKNDSEHSAVSTAQYIILPGENRTLTGSLLVPVTLTIVVRETEQDDELTRDAFVSDTTRLLNMGHSVETFDTTNKPLSFHFILQLDNSWRLESEQRRFGGVGAFFAALLAILGLYEVTLLASELAHRVFHSIEKRRKKRSKYQALEDPPLIVNEKAE